MSTDWSWLSKVKFLDVFSFDDVEGWRPVVAILALPVVQVVEVLQWSVIAFDGKSVDSQLKVGVSLVVSIGEMYVWWSRKESWWSFPHSRPRRRNK